MQTAWFRLRAILDRHFALVAVALVALALLGGWVTYGAHVDPGTTTEQRTVSSWSHTGVYSHAATVTKQNPVYPLGETLTNRTVYLPFATPVLNGSFAFAYDATDSGSLNVTVTNHVLVRSVQERRRESVEVWRQSRSRETTAVSDVEPGETVRVPFSINVNRTMNRTERIDEEMNRPPGDPRLEIRTTVRLSGTVNGQTVNRTEDNLLLVTFGRGAYRVNGSAATARSETTRTFTVPREPGSFESVGGPVLFALGFLGVVGFGTLRARNELALTPPERERLKFEDERKEFDEWINVFELSSPSGESGGGRSHAVAGSLGDLVDLAIDTNNSVIEHPDEETFYVFHDGREYTFEAPLDPTETESTSADDQEADEGSTLFGGVWGIFATGRSTDIGDSHPGGPDETYEIADVSLEPDPGTDDGHPGELNESYEIDEIRDGVETEAADSPEEPTAGNPADGADGADGRTDPDGA